MHIPTLYVLISAEIIFLLMIATIILVIYALKLKQRIKEILLKPDIENEKPVISSVSYAEYLQKALERNTKKTQQQKHIESEKTAEAAESPEKQHSALLKARDMFLNMEKSASEHTENENLFWDQVYSGMKTIIEQLKTIEHEKEIITKEVVEHKTTTKEKVFYIETQGKKVDGEVNKLKDIIYEQENTLSSLQKALSRSIEHEAEESEEIAELRTHINSFERQLNDSKMCMEVLELENERLQHELSELETRYSGSDKGNTKQQTDKDTSSSTIDLAQMREVLENQEKQIQELNQAIDNLKLEADQAERLKTAIKDFARTSREMMGCIAILEEENEHLKQQVHGSEEHQTNASSTEEALEQYQVKIKELEQEVIKKDVAIAKLQDEFSSMEQEYLAMYEAMHGEN